MLLAHMLSEIVLIQVVNRHFIILDKCSPTACCVTWATLKTRMKAPCFDATEVMPGSKIDASDGYHTTKK